MDLKHGMNYLLQLVGDMEVSRICDGIFEFQVVMWDLQVSILMGRGFSIFSHQQWGNTHQPFLLFE